MMRYLILIGRDEIDDLEKIDFRDVMIQRMIFFLARSSMFRSERYDTDLATADSSQEDLAVIFGSDEQSQAVTFDAPIGRLDSDGRKVLSAIPNRRKAFGFRQFLQLALPNRDQGQEGLPARASVAQVPFGERSRFAQPICHGLTRLAVVTG